jgi:hypothetical protein
VGCHDQTRQADVKGTQAALRSAVVSLSRTRTPTPASLGGFFATTPLPMWQEMVMHGAHERIRIDQMVGWLLEILS